VPFEHGTIAQIVVQRDAGVVDEDIESFDLIGSCLDLGGAGHVKGQGRDAPAGVSQGLARAGIHPLRASGESLSDQRLPDAAIGPGHQNRFVCDYHYILLANKCGPSAYRGSR
jgi:hypothetical protein